jgi:hypothetical protein
MCQNPTSRLPIASVVQDSSNLVGVDADWRVGLPRQDTTIQGEGFSEWAVEADYAGNRCRATAAIPPADAHAVLLVDQARWQTSDKLRVPGNISIVLLPPKSPEMNPTENTWQTVCSFAGSEMVRPHYAAGEGCAGLAGAWPLKGDNPCSRIAAAFLSGLIRPR